MNRILFVWDGSTRNLAMANEFVSCFSTGELHVVHAMPHKAYVGESEFIDAEPANPSVSHKIRLAERFDLVVENFKHLKDASFQMVYGDRIREVVRLAESLEAIAILTVHFRQSSFSRWIHGNLDQRIKSSASCPVVFLDHSPSRKKGEGLGTSQAN